MAHPHAEHRQSKVEKSRVSSLTRGYASGGAVHPDAAEDKALVKKMVKPKALKADGEAPKYRADRPGRKKGGRVNKPKGTNVNVIIGSQHPAPVAGLGAAPPVAPPMPPPMAAAPPRPPIAGPPGGAPMPGVMPPPGMPPRHAGGRTYKKGGRVGVNAGTKVFEDSLKLGTQVTHSPGKNDQDDVKRGKQITYRTGGAVNRATGGPVEHPTKGGMGPKFPGGAGSGETRVVQADRAARNYKRA